MFMSNNYARTSITNLTCIDVAVCTVNIVIEKINIHNNCTLTAQFYTLLSYLSITWTVGTNMAIHTYHF